MREIKFRAWDKEKKRFGYFHLGWGRVSFPSVDYMEHNNTADEIFDFPTVECWQEFTGLKDKNATEIYEGDITEILAEDGSINRCVVKFGTVERGIAWGWDIEGVDITGFYFEVNGFPTFPVVHNWDKKHDLEIMQIVGNVYENPELLEDKE